MRSLRPSCASGKRSVLALAAVLVCLAAEAAVLQVGIDDLDEGYFAAQAVRVLHGQVPYRDFDSLYTPGLAYVHAAIFDATGGPYLLGPRVFGLLARTGLVALLFRLTRPLVKRPLWAAAPGVLLLIGLDAVPERWEPHPGWPSAALSVLAVWCLARRPSRSWLLAAGAAAGGAYLFKQNAGAFVLLAILARPLLIRQRPHPVPRARRLWVREIAWPLLGFGMVTLVWLVPLLIAVQWRIELLTGFVGATSQAGLLSPPQPTLLIALACLAGGVWLVRGHPDPTLQWYLLSGVAMFLTQYPRMDTLHLAWSTPLLLVLGAIALDRHSPRASAVVLCGVTVLVLPTLMYRSTMLRQPTVPIQTPAYASGLRVPVATRDDLRAVVADIQKRTLAREPILVYPSSPLLYVLADRPNPTRFDHLNPGAAGPTQIEQVPADASRVRVVVVSEFWRRAWRDPGTNRPLEAWLENGFGEVARYGDYRVLARL